MSDAELDANSPLRARWGTFVAVPAVFLVGEVPAPSFIFNPQRRAPKPHRQSS